ncbi:hypothetical protein A3755_08745 [Oleiphilus sp. HI0085]|nr:hypothetical protein [Oleiphilus sp. HI0128]KZY89113.1 hypothetical protein A3743_09200 [Oleiphilus sp. HI0072]KZZ32981.1 hypothetical protein A3755_08745 [Oleiphilus sp. HI0085]KZZ33221.1 hypothetical protein A3757_04075 [Oleiphilus sp. HI0117]KZZ75551.1 hypothetical protein A3766_03255 [Oleiphilus sp. HI0132]KZZ65395.1 hypothetical protein A3763_18565 [Oleiphilus sp. HI0128]
MLRMVLVRFVGVLMLSGGVLAGGPENQVPEPIVLQSLDNEAITFQAKSNGCTKPEDFRMRVQGRDVSVLRVKKDSCRRMPFWKTFSLPISLDSREVQVYLLNPLVLRPL